MDSDISIFFDDRVVVLTDKSIKSPAIDSGCVYVFENKKALAGRLERFSMSDDRSLHVIHTDVDELFCHVAGCFKCVEAAGGLVTLTDGRILVIRRLGRWDLPKGKAEKGESPQETALREVMEECGLGKRPVITAELTHTYHVYSQHENSILKHTAWYSMRYDGDETLYPQFSENITGAEWLPADRLDAVLQNTYQSIRQVLKTIVT